MLQLASHVISFSILVRALSMMIATQVDDIDLEGVRQALEAANQEGLFESIHFDTRFAITKYRQQGNGKCLS